MIPGEVITVPGDLELNAGAAALTLQVANTGDRPIAAIGNQQRDGRRSGVEFDRARSGNDLAGDHGYTLAAAVLAASRLTDDLGLLGIA